MKASTFAVLLLLSATLLAAVAQPVIAVGVEDTSGSELLQGANYRIIFASHGSNRVLSAALRNNSCPPTVAEGPGEVAALNGLPIQFFPAVPGATVVNVSTNLLIQFTPATELMNALLRLCSTKFSIWKVSDVDATTGKQYVTGGGTPPPEKRFRIEAHGRERTYKIVYCQDSCRIDQCGDAACRKNVGSIVEDGKVWLGLTDEATPFMFQKAQSTKLCSH